MTPPVVKWKVVSVLRMNQLRGTLRLLSLGAPSNRLRRGTAPSRVPDRLRRQCHPTHLAHARVGARPRKKKHHTKRSLRAIKAQWRLFQQLVADTKYLQDIPYYWPQMQRLRLPRFQYTVREPVSGLCLTGYADERSKSYAVLLAERVSAHLAWHGVDWRKVEWQTDNGAEFLEDAGGRGLPSTVRALGSGHHYIPPKAHTWQSDVETVHRLEEDEFFDREDFGSPAEFWAKITTYWRDFNLARPNRYKEWHTPLQILHQRNPKLDLTIAAWRPLDLGSILS